jgi:hypothetical protein
MAGLKDPRLKPWGTQKQTAKAEADPCGMTNKRTSNSKDEIQGFFAALRMTALIILSAFTRKLF